MYVDEYVIKKGFKLTIGGHEILPSEVDIYCNKEQKEILLKNKTIKKKKGEFNERESKSTEAESQKILSKR